MIITAIVSILIGFYKEFIIIVLLILTHEIGHVLCAKAFGIKTIQVLLYPLGGISKINIDINENPMKEMLIIIMGPLFQWITYELLLSFFQERELIQQIHYGILSFNLLPIYPLDGGKLFNILMNHIFSYRKSFKISIIIGYVITITILYCQKKFSINIITIYSVLMFLIYQEEIKSKLYFQKFLLERIHRKYPYKKYKIIKDIKNMYRYRQNIIHENNILISEREYLLQKYDKFGKNY